MANSKSKIPSLNIYEWTFHRLHGNQFTLEMQGGRVVAIFEPDQRYFDLTARYNSNEAVNVLDYSQAQRELRAMMLTLKTEKRKGE